ncbi:MAG: hypothetical protein M3441_13770 [Chloroflexota bacterium]|nr:hypothetical protein [Chloroflexota bacterium]
MLGLVPRPLHAVLDYLWSASLFAAPHLFGFSNDERAVLFCRTKAATAFVISLLTRYELGLIKVLPFNMHLAGDALDAVVGLAAPSVVGFDKNDKARNTVLAFVLFEIGAVLLSKPDRK